MPYSALKKNTISDHLFCHTRCIPICIASYFIYLLYTCHIPPISPLFPYTTLFRSCNPVLAARDSGHHSGPWLSHPCHPHAALFDPGHHPDCLCGAVFPVCEDRKSTRLNSSHGSI